MTKTLDRMFAGSDLAGSMKATLSGSKFLDPALAMSDLAGSTKDSLSAHNMLDQALAVADLTGSMKAMNTASKSLGDIEDMVMPSAMRSVLKMESMPRPTTARGPCNRRPGQRAFDLPTRRLADGHQWLGPHQPPATQPRFRSQHS